MLRPAQINNITARDGQRSTKYATGCTRGLYIQVRQSGAKSWLLRTVVNGRRRELGLGSYPEVSLASARERARHIRDQIFFGEFGREAITFKEAVDRFLRMKLTEFRNEKHRDQWENTLRQYAVPVLGALPVDQIQVRDVLKVLEPIWIEKTETASRLRGRIEAVIAWATASGYREGDNPARWRGNLDAVLPAPGK